VTRGSIAETLMDIEKHNACVRRLEPRVSQVQTKTTPTPPRKCANEIFLAHE
jgi:hypothetical protein